MGGAPRPSRTIASTLVDAVGGRSEGREAVGEFPRSDDFLYINDKKSILRWILSVSGAPLRPPAALL